VPLNHPLIAVGCFKPAAGRLALPAPFVRGPVRHYLATEMEKAEVIATMVTRRPVLKLAVLILVLLMWVGHSRRWCRCSGADATIRRRPI
jgi:hypothetical protein